MRPSLRRRLEYILGARRLPGLWSQVAANAMQRMRRVGGGGLVSLGSFRPEDGEYRPGARQQWHPTPASSRRPKGRFAPFGLSLTSNARAPMQVRVLTPRDAAAFQALRVHGLQKSPSAFASSYEEESETPIEVVAERLAAKDGCAVFGAFHEGELVGNLGLERQPMRKLAHKAGLWGMYVKPSARALGVGSQLVAEALSYARGELRVRQVGLAVNATNIAAISLYRKHGFEQFGLERGSKLLNGELHDEIHMVCFLPPAP